MPRYGAIGFGRGVFLRGRRSRRSASWGGRSITSSSGWCQSDSCALDDSCALESFALVARRFGIGKSQHSNVTRRPALAIAPWER